MKAIPFNHVRSYYFSHQPNGHWFDAASMKFFNTKTPASAYETKLGVLFVTSEVDPSGNKRYSVRRQHVSGEISTIGDFHHFPTAAAARAEIKRLDNLELPL